jgi:biotin carboxylase
MRPFAGRRLLILGAGHYQIPVIRRAQALGCHVITLDYVASNPGHALADAHHIVSTVDMDAVLGVARAERVDGVLTYGSDVSAPTVAYVAERMRLPGNPAGICAALQQKHLFRQFQRDAGLPHPAFVTAESGPELAERLRASGMPLPVVIKPADSSGSKGQTIAGDGADIAAAFARARVFSRCGVVLAEQFLPGDTLELVGEVFVQHGRLAGRQYGHNYFLEGAAPDVRVPVGELVPMVARDGVEAELDRQFQLLIDAAGLRAGCLNFDGVLSAGRVYLLDLGIRNGGNYLDDLIELSTGQDFTAAAIHAALGADYALERADAVPRPLVSYIFNSRVAGVFDRVTIAPAFEPCVRKLEIFASRGDRVDAYTRGDRGLGVVLLELASMAEALDLLPRLPDVIEVRVASDGVERRA